MPHYLFQPNYPNTMLDHEYAQHADARPATRPGSRDKAIDHLIHLKGLRNDAHLSRYLGVTAATVCKIRAGKLGVSAGILLRLHEKFGIPVAELRELLEQD